MYFSKTPTFFELAFPSLVWRIRDQQKSIFLTFDDGPDPEVTPVVLDLLDRYEAHATFFCVGQKAEQHRDLFESLTARGHSVGNHTFHHMNGKKTSDEVYIKDVEKASHIIPSTLFRPPYGRITNSQVRALKKHYHLIMWSVLPGDFDRRTSREKVLRRARRHTRKGGIVVFHDNRKFREKMLFALEGFLANFHDQGFQFKPITSSLLNHSKIA
jgi:peptidoglycan/xylan/chitin deacetylase (PgdA/CDA1 family)